MVDNNENGQKENEVVFETRRRVLKIARTERVINEENVSVAEESHGEEDLDGRVYKTNIMRGKLNEVALNRDGRIGGICRC